VFGGEPRADEPTVDLKVLHAKIGQLALENERVTRFTMLLHLPLLAGHMPGAHTKNGPAMIGHGAEAVRNAIAAKIATQNNWAGR
jgi:hypothetical protein